MRSGIEPFEREASALGRRGASRDREPMERPDGASPSILRAEPADHPWIPRTPTIAS
jgi:hypothetical protein